METNYPFKKIQVTITLKENSDKLKSVTIIAVEVAYPNSSGEYVWKSSSRLLDYKKQLFVKTKNRNGKEIDAILPSMWTDLKDNPKAFVFDFVKNETPSKIKIREQILTATNTNEVKEYDVLETDKEFYSSFLQVTIAEKVIGID
ncbi:MAG TPA: hypothetical protein VJ780_06625 [Flavobacterium sp.]|nr:hypothetical protein [Flavobacterium sp.]